MKPFRFRLATLLRLRVAARDRRRAHLAQAYEAEDVLQQRQGELADEVVGVEVRDDDGVDFGWIDSVAFHGDERRRPAIEQDVRVAGLNLYAGLKAASAAKSVAAS